MRGPNINTHTDNDPSHPGPEVHGQQGNGSGTFTQVDCLRSMLASATAPITVFVPIFVSAYGSGSHAYYLVTKFAQFEFHGAKAGSGSHSVNDGVTVADETAMAAHGGNNWLYGKFIKFVDTSAQLDPTVKCSNDLSVCTPPKLVA